MFGYVVINKPDMKIKDFETYKSFYCGLCRELKNSYGTKGQLTLNYDLTFLSILLSGLYENDPEIKSVSCIAHPFEKHLCLRNEFTEYAADMNMLLTYYKFEDDKKDENSLKANLMCSALKKSGIRVAEKYPEKAEIIETELNRLYELEKQDSTDIDEVAGCFGRLMASLFVYKHDEWEEYLKKLGFYLGKFIYILDAYVDYDEDIKNNNYNPMKEIGKDTDKCREMLTMMMAEVSKSFEMLPIIDYFDILENILYSGVWCGFHIGNQKEKKNSLLE